MKNYKNPLNLRDVIFQHIKPVVVLVIFAILANVLALFFPKIIAYAIDSYTKGVFEIRFVSILFISLALVVLFFTFLQSIVEVYVSEKTARVLRSALIKKISGQSYLYTQEKTSAFLLTNLTSDVSAIKQFISSSVPSLIAAICTLIVASILILTTDWKLGLGVLIIIPLIGLAFYLTFSKMGKLFSATQMITDKLNAVINTTIVSAALVRILNSGRIEFQKFQEINIYARENGIRILTLFASLIPIVMFASSIAVLIILYIGGNFVISGDMTLGQFVAFNSYVSILLFPIFIIGFTSSSIGRGIASMERIASVFLAPDLSILPNLITSKIHGDIQVNHLCLKIEEKQILRNISFSIRAKSQTAIIGPTASGKSQLLAVMSGLIPPTSGDVTFDAKLISQYHPNSFYKSVGIVFQDSILFNLSIRDNIAFGSGVNNEYIDKAIQTAELTDFIHTLPKGLDTLVSERGLTLSGGQKQRIMLARALATNPSVLFLDDFTARVDALTEKNILQNLKREFSDITLISVTQKISATDQYDNIIVLVEGEVLAEGTHEKLMTTSLEYVQIYESQKSTTNYEL